MKQLIQNLKDGRLDFSYWLFVNGYSIQDPGRMMQTDIKVIRYLILGGRRRLNIEQRAKR